MNYYFSKVVDLSFDEAIERVTALLKDEGFGILTEIDVTSTFKKKLDVDFRNYRILGACNPNFAYQAMQKEARIGLMMPCNVVVQETEEQTIEVSAIDPIASMQAIVNPELEDFAREVRDLLSKTIDKL